MIVLLTVSIICATAIYLARHASIVLVARWRQDRDALYTAKIAERALEDRRIAVSEREMAIREKQIADRPGTVAIPEDLVGRIRLWDDPAAQDNERTIIMELYGELKDWELVRKRLPNLAPVLSTEPVAPRDGLYS